MAIFFIKKSGGIRISFRGLLRNLNKKKLILKKLEYDDLSPRKKKKNHTQIHIKFYNFFPQFFIF